MMEQRNKSDSNSDVSSQLESIRQMKANLGVPSGGEEMRSDCCLRLLFILLSASHGLR